MKYLKPQNRVVHLLLSMLFVSASFACRSSGNVKGTISKIPEQMQKTMMRQGLWKSGCPVALKDLSLLSVPYWGFDHRTHLGSLIVYKALAQNVLLIFKTLYLHRFPIKKMDPIVNTKIEDGSDNNTYAFMCRAVTNQPGIYSQHSYGRAIDINPLINPYVKGNQVIPNNGRKFIHQNYPGKITKDGFVFKLFSRYGWDWGGLWHDLKDLQHFEKRAGEKRNPHGYPEANK
jgi:D-alanyl-D-alanine carboxypeptidase